jgi:hypothetical protein
VGKAAAATALFDTCADTIWTVRARILVGAFSSNIIQLPEKFIFPDKPSTPTERGGTMPSFFSAIPSADRNDLESKPFFNSARKKSKYFF